MNLLPFLIYIRDRDSNYERWAIVQHVVHSKEQQQGKQPGMQFAA
jgi:hypothetical protein